MSAVHRGTHPHGRQAALMFAGLLSIAVIAGGTGGYLIRGGPSTVVVTGVSPVSPAVAQPVTGALTEPHDAIPTQGPARDSQSGYGAPAPPNHGSGGLNADSAAGY